MKNLKENTLKGQRAITLIALVVTIIVLLILAGISIAMLTGQNGILNRASTAKNDTGIAQIDEQVKIAVGGALAKGLGTISYNDLKEELDERFGAENYTITPTNDNTESWTVTITKPVTREYTITKKGHITGLTTNTGSNTGTNTGTGETGGGAASAINFGEGKTKDTVTQGDTIEITFETGETAYSEQFMMLTKSNNQILTIPYYNITLDVTNPVQSSTWDNTMKCNFSNSRFWNETRVNIEPMSSSSIQQFINAYNTKISNATGGRATAIVGRCYGNGLDNIDSFVTRGADMPNLLNPSGVGAYWIGSSGGVRVENVPSINERGTNLGYGYTNNYTCGVRPVVIIDISNLEES